MTTLIDHHRRPCFGKAGSLGGRAASPDYHPSRLSFPRLQRVYLSFDYSQDLARVRKVARLAGVAVNTAAGLESPDYWESARIKGDRIVKGMIDAALENSSVTVVCIDQYTAHSRFVMYEIERTLELGHGLVGIHVSHLPDTRGKVAPRGATPSQIKMAGFKVYDYCGAGDLEASIVEAADLAGL